MSDFKQICEPPWKAFPEINPDELSRYLKQGSTEVWFDHEWRPFWLGLTATQRDEYLDFWDASRDWRSALSFHFSQQEDFNLEEDARESEQYLRQGREERLPKTLSLAIWRDAVRIGRASLVGFIRIDKIR